MLTSIASGTAVPAAPSKGVKRLMGTEIILALLLITLVIACIYAVNLFVTHKAKALVDFLESEAESCTNDPYFEKYERTRIYFNTAAVAGHYDVNDRGLYLYSNDRFNVRLPWGKIYAVRIVDFKGQKMANFRVNTPYKIDRRLSLEWNPDFNAFIPESVVTIRK